MNNQGGSNDNIHLGDTQIFGNLTVSESFTVEGGFEVVGDLIIDPPACLKTDCVKPVTASAAVEIKNSSDDTVAIFNDDQSIGAFSIYGNSGGLLLSSDSGGQSVAQLNQGLGLSTAGLRLINTKLNVDEIQSQSHEVSGSNPKILFTASKVEITGDTATEFETKTILTSDIKKDDTGGNLTIKAADGTQILRTDDNLKEVYIGEDADGYRMPKLRDTIGHILTMSNTGVATFEEPAQTGAHTVIGTIVVPRTVYGFGSYANVAISLAGTSSIAPNTWAIGDVLTIRLLGEYTATSRTGGTSNFRLVVGALGSVVSSFVNPATNGAVSKQPFELSIGLTRTSATNINFVGTGIFQDNDGANKPSKQFDFSSGVITGYDEKLALPVDIEYIDNSTSGTGSGYVRYVATSGIWTQSTPSSVVPVISTADHTALSNLELGDAGHSQFALLTGRSGGQTLIGGSSLSSENLLLRSNSIDPTSGYVKIQSDVIMSDQTIWGSEAPSGFLRLASTSDGIKGQILMLDEVLVNADLVMNGNDIRSVGVGAGLGLLVDTNTTNNTGSVVIHSDVSSAGSGAIITAAERTSIGTNTTLANSKLPLTGGTLTGKLEIDDTTPLLELTDTNNTVWGNGSGNITFKGTVGGTSVFVGETGGGSNFLISSYAPTKGIDIRANNNTMTLGSDGTLSLPSNLNMATSNIINAAEIQALGALILKGAPNIELYGSSGPGGGTIELKTNTTSVYDVSTSLAPSTGDNLCNKTYVDGKAAEYLPLAGGTLSGSLDMSGFNVANVNEINNRLVDSLVLGSSGGDYPNLDSTVKFDGALSFWQSLDLNQRAFYNPPSGGDPSSGRGINSLTTFNAADAIEFDVIYTMNQYAGNRGFVRLGIMELPYVDPVRVNLGTKSYAMEFRHNASQVPVLRKYRGAGTTGGLLNTAMDNITTLTAGTTWVRLNYNNVSATKQFEIQFSNDFGTTWVVGYSDTIDDGLYQFNLTMYDGGNQSGYLFDWEVLNPGSTVCPGDVALFVDSQANVIKGFEGVLNGVSTINASRPNDLKIQRNSVDKLEITDTKVIVFDPLEAKAGITQFAGVLATPSPVNSGFYSQVADRTILFTQGDPPTPETSLFNTTGSQGTLVIPANAVQIGSSYKVLLSGYLSTNGTEEITFRAYLNGNLVPLIAQTGAESISSTAGIPVFWKCELNYTVQTIGAAGSVMLSGLFYCSKQDTLNSSGSFIIPSAALINTTIAQTLDITGQWNATKTSNITCQTANVRSIY